VEAKAGATAFIDGLSDRDSLGIMFFSNNIDEVPVPKPLSTSRDALRAQVDNSFASGGTALYEAVAKAYDAMLARAKKDPGQIHAIVVMTDGKDEDSKISIDQLDTRFNPENAPVKIFTIAYGDKADPAILQTIAQAAQGTSVKGNSSTIVEVYKDLSAFF
ncbi:MAG TPA: VWA domain-containing protein, partial [Kofleriaceae bacterium]